MPVCWEVGEAKSPRKGSTPVFASDCWLHPHPPSLAPPRPAPPPTSGQVSGGQWASTGQVPANLRLAALRLRPGRAVLGRPGAGVCPGWTREGGSRVLPARAARCLARNPRQSPRRELPSRPQRPALLVVRGCPTLHSLSRQYSPRHCVPASPAGAERGRAGGRGR